MHQARPITAPQDRARRASRGPDKRRVFSVAPTAVGRRAACAGRARLLVQAVVQVAVDLLRVAVLAQQPAQHAQAPHPQHLGGQARLARAAPLACGAHAVASSGHARRPASGGPLFVIVGEIAQRGACSTERARLKPRRAARRPSVLVSAERAAAIPQTDNSTDYQCPIAVRQPCNDHAPQQAAAQPASHNLDTITARGAAVARSGTAH